MVTTLYLIRHGETEGNETKRYKGSIDVPLSENGEAQIRETAGFMYEYLKNTSASRHMSYLSDIHGTPGNPKAEPALKAVYCSDLKRAVKSAGIIAEGSGLSPVELPWLRERNFGIWEGMTFDEIKNKYPSAFEDWASNPLRFSPVGGESTLEVRERVIPALTELFALHKGDNIAVVAHGGVNRIIICHFLDVPLENVFRIEQDYAAVNVIELWEKYPVVKLINGGACRG